MATSASSKAIAIKYIRYRRQWKVEIGTYCDGLIPKEYKDELISQTQSLIQDKTKLNYRNIDLTNKTSLKNVQIQDLIEPHNYNPVFFNKAKPPKPSNPLQQRSALLSEIKKKKKVIKKRRLTKQSPALIPEPEPLQINPYIPAVFELNEATNSYEIKSEINDLPRYKYPKLYDVIQNIFTKMVPGIEVSLDTNNTDNEKELEVSLKDVEFLKRVHSINKDPLEYNYLHKKYLVIVKMTDYQFMNGKVHQVRYVTNK